MYIKKIVTKRHYFTRKLFNSPQNVRSRLPQGVIICPSEAVVPWGRFQMAIQGQENPSHVKVVCPWLSMARGTVNENQLLCSLMSSRMEYIRFKCLHYNSALIDYRLDYKLILNKDFVVGVFLSKNYTYREAGRRPLLPFTAESKK